MKKNKSSKDWINKRRRDIYVRQSKIEGYKSRAIYKLKEIDEKFKILKEVKSAVDLGAAPGSWTQYLVKKISKGKIVSIDLLKFEPIKNTHQIIGNFTDEKYKKDIKNYFNDEVDIVKMLTVWTLFNAVFAAIGCILARGHPLAILTATLASPITSLNPALAAGWFAGYVQLRVSEPTAEDLQLFLKGTSIGGFWSNRAGRVLLVTALTNLGSMLGAWFAAAGFIGGGIT